MYKNASFFKRLLANIIDLICFFSLVLLSFYLLRITKKPNDLPSAGVFYFGVVLIWLFLALFYQLIPVLFNGKTIGLWICKLKIINSKTKEFSKISIFKHNYFITWFFFVILLITLSFLSHKSFVWNEQKQITLRNDLYHQIVLRIITTLLTMHFFILIAGYFMLLVSKRNLILIDLLTETRVVEDKQIRQVISELKFLPQKNIRRKFIYK